MNVFVVKKKVTFHFNENIFVQINLLIKLLEISQSIQNFIEISSNISDIFNLVFIFDEKKPIF